MKALLLTSPASAALSPAATREGRIAIRPAMTRMASTQAAAAFAIGSLSGTKFCFGRHELLVRERLLLKEGARVSVGSRAFDLLLALVERAGETVNRQDLFERVWPDVIVAKVNLRVHVAGLRKALGDGRDGNRFIVSVAGRGYSFVAPVDHIRGTVALRQDSPPTVCVVDLAGIADPAHVISAVAAALGLEIDHERALIRVLDHLRDKRMLLAFEHCEHVFAGVARFIERLVAEAPGVQILIGNRAPPRWR